MSDNRFRIVARTELGTFSFLALEQRVVEAPDGSRIERVVVRHPGAVAVVPLVGDSIVLIEQYRVAADRPILEIPAGKLDPHDDSVEEAARRELLEETGYSAGSFRTLTAIWTAVGFSDEQITLLLAEDLSEGSRRPEGAEERASTIVLIPFDEAVRRVVSGQITDSKTVAGILITDAIRRTA